MRAWLVVLALTMLVMGSVASAQEGESHWTGLSLASDDLVAVRGLYDVGERVKIGADVTWLDGLAPDESEGWRVSFAATYDLMQQADFKALFVEVPATLYIGGLGGVLIEEDQDPDATAAIATGFVLGGQRASIGIEWQYLLTQDLWREFADIPDESRLLFYAGFRF